jgi:hypothetical protein
VRGTLPAPPPPIVRPSYDQASGDGTQGRIDLRRRRLARQPASLACLRRPECHSRRGGITAADDSTIDEHGIGFVARVDDLMTSVGDDRGQSSAAQRIGRD